MAVVDCTSYNGMTRNFALIFISRADVNVLQHARLAPASEALHCLFILHETFFYSKSHGSFPHYHYGSKYHLPCWLFPTTLFVIVPSLILSSFCCHALIPFPALFFLTLSIITSYLIYHAYCLYLTTIQ